VVVAADLKGVVDITGVGAIGVPVVERKLLVRVGVSVVATKVSI
jgi:hypothetical protein